MSLKICSLGSGSKGNSVLVSNNDICFLIDCGLTVRQINHRLKQAGRSLNDISFILITHEHSDHIKSCDSLSSVYNIPIVLHSNTYKSVSVKNEIVFDRLKGFALHNLVVTPFSVSHDVFTVGYTIEDKDSKITYATDLGHAEDTLVEHAKGSRAIMLESNYDEKMLLSGRYPYFLKKRIQSQHGHLSNTDCASTLYKLAKNGTSSFVLGHLSMENNLPELALSKAREVLFSDEFQIEIATQSEVGVCV